jgi:predicted dehydrogenase
MPLTAGIIGTGGVAGMGLLGIHDEETIGHEKVDASHAGGYGKSDRVELVAVADIDEEKLTRFGEVWDVPEADRYPGHEAMLEARDLDVVSVATPTSLHHEHTVAAARSAANPDAIWCEKPIATSVGDAEEMIDVCAETDTELVINHTSRFTHNIQQVRTLIREENLLGDVHSANAMFRMELMRNSTHLLDTLVYLLDTRASEVSGYITGNNEAVDALGADAEVDDAGGGGMIVTEDGAFVTVDCTVPREDSTYSYHFVGTEGRLQINIADGEWRYWRLADGGHVEEELSGLRFGENEYAKGFANAVEHLADLIEGDAANLSPGEDGLRSLEIIVAFYVSEYTGSRVSLPLERPLRDIDIRSW